MGRRTPPRGNRRRVARRHALRRRADFYQELGKFAGLIGVICVAIVGQAELIGEPWRHYVTVTAIISGAIWAYGMKPKSLLEALQAYRSGKGMLL